MRLTGYKVFRERERERERQTKRDGGEKRKARESIVSIVWVCVDERKWLQASVCIHLMFRVQDSGFSG